MSAAAETQTVPPALATRYRQVVRSRVIALALMAAVLLASLAVDVASGPSSFPLSQLATGLWRPDTLDAAQRVILWDVRLPYAVMAVLVGASLGLAGAEMQTALDNPLASPFTLGIAAAASVGASLVIVSGFDAYGLGEPIAVPAGAFLCAAGATLLIQTLTRVWGAGVDTVVLFGIALMFTFEALLWLLQFIASPDSLQQIVFWVMGSLSRATWDKIAVVATTLLVCMVWAQRQAWTMTALRGGEDQARSLGIAVERLRLVTLLRVSLLSAAALAFVGTIGFVGLVGPHIARLLLGEDHRFLLPGSALAGAVMLSVASVLSKTLVPGVVLPVGIITALVGVPVFMGLILKHRSRR
ncbi:FecCD family ABC transporter permease [Caldimonas brevitalea]|uniref:Iron ABC transporter permease n=1 Tax=Caldimonas brevitalea TaxID=413882 RepID=A0A0G3BJZ6_9BURK|nr:iron ABC transporter permease [Caldimonas brevitalea]AKJ29742.1 iron ABC transporter permease [Caldimonas brevitalea]